MRARKSIRGRPSFAMALRASRGMRRCCPSRDVTQRSLVRSQAYVSSFPRRVRASGFVLSVRIHPPNEGVAERRQAHSSLLCRACEARRPRERNAGRPVATGTPSRRSVVAIFGRGPVLPPPAVAPEPTSDLPASGHNAWWAGSRTSRAAVRAAIAGRHSPLHRQDRLRRRPLLSEDGKSYTTASHSSQELSSLCSRNIATAD